MFRYGLNIGFNLWNKQVFNAFPFPWTVSAVHVVVGLIYCTISYFLGFKKASFGRVSSLLWLLHELLERAYLFVRNHMMSPLLVSMMNIAKSL